MVSNTRNLVTQVKSDKEKMSVIRSKFNKANAGSRLIKFSERYLKIFKAGITDLNAKLNCIVNRSNIFVTISCTALTIQWNLQAIIKRTAFAIREAAMKIAENAAKSG